ncbi:motility protein A [Nitriliruptoraceae bacterium ZYF776]|nr:motility protein A [Profundirhabdus halotolerans]
MDPLFIGGLALTLVGIVVSTILDGNSLGPLIGPTSFIMVLSGAVGAGSMAFRMQDLKALPQSAMAAIKRSPPDVGATIDSLAGLADTARRDGMLALEAKLEEIDDRFVQLGIQLLVDGGDEDVLRETLEIEISATDERHRTSISFFKSLAAYAPTFGMVGTVIGLINMLGNLSDPSQLGKGMAMALLTTLYGVLFANLLFNPVATRLERANELELAAMDVALDGILTIRRGASPRALVERLESYLPPSERIGAAERLGGGPKPPGDATPEAA